jgi:hypothetical protein
VVAYQLRNRSIPILGEVSQKLEGLGLNPPPPSVERVRGEDPFYPKHNPRVTMDMAAGRQLSIFGALRAVQTPDGVSK